MTIENNGQLAWTFEELELASVYWEVDEEVNALQVKISALNDICDDLDFDKDLDAYGTLGRIRRGYTQRFLLLISVKTNIRKLAMYGGVDLYV